MLPASDDEPPIFAVGQALGSVISAIVRNVKSVFDRFHVLEGEYGLSQVCLGVPAHAGRKPGVERSSGCGSAAGRTGCAGTLAGVLKQADSSVGPAGA